MANKSNGLTPHEIFYQRYPNAEGAPPPPPPVTNNIYFKRIMCLAAAAFWLAMLFSPVTILPFIIAILPGKLLFALYLLPTFIAFMRGHNWLHIGMGNLLCFPFLLPGWLLVLLWACAPNSSQWGPYHYTRYRYYGYW